MIEMDMKLPPPRPARPAMIEMDMKSSPSPPSKVDRDG